MELFTGVCQDLGYPAAHVDARAGGTERAWTFLDRRIMQQPSCGTASATVEALGFRA